MSENNYAKVIVKGSPISKSNFKLFNPLTKRAILPSNTGKYHDRYAIYEEEIAYECSIQNPGVSLTESLIAVLKVYYKSEKRHPDTNNITKSILDGVEKSGLIINDAQVRRLIIEEFYDKENPRFELELFGESSYCIDYKIIRLSETKSPINYELPSNKKNKSLAKSSTSLQHPPLVNKVIDNKKVCSICNKSINNNDSMSYNGGKGYICKNCFKKLF